MSGYLQETLLFALAGADYAFGLEWIAASSSLSARTFARRQARRLGATHLAWRPHRHQVGLARISAAKRGSFWRAWRAAAASFADMPQPPAEPHTMIGAFAFTSGEVWVVAASQGRLLAEGDRLFTELEEAKAHFRQLYERVPRWGLVFAPPDWGYARAKPEGPLSFLSSSRPSSGPVEILRSAMGWAGVAGASGTALHKLGGGSAEEGRALWNLAAVMAAIAGLAVGGWRLSSGRHRPPASLPQQPLVLPWYPSVTRSADQLEVCVPAIVAGLNERAAPGWEIGELSCDGAALKIALAARNYTPLSSLADFRPGANLQSTTRSAALVQALAKPQAVHPIAPPLPSPEDVLAAFGRLDEQLRAINAFSPPAAPPEPAPVELGMPRPRPYRLMNWSLQTTAPPSFWRVELAALPAVEITLLSLKRGDGGLVWTVKGVAYVSP